MRRMLSHILRVAAMLVFLLTFGCDFVNKPRSHVHEQRLAVLEQDLNSLRASTNSNIRDLQKYSDQEFRKVRSDVHEQLNSIWQDLIVEARRWHSSRLALEKQIEIEQSQWHKVEEQLMEAVEEDQDRIHTF